MTTIINAVADQALTTNSDVTFGTITTGPITIYPVAPGGPEIQWYSTSYSTAWIVSLTNASFGQNSLITIPDPASATANMVLAPAALVSGNIPQASGTTGLLIDSGIPASSIATLTTAVLLSPSTNQTIVNAHDLIMSTGRMIAPTMLPGNLSLSGNSLTSTNTNGNIGIIPNGTGTTIISGITPFTTALDLQIPGVGHNPDMALGCYANDSTHSGVYYTYRSRSITIGSFVPVQSGDIVAYFTGRGDDGTTFQNVSAMQYNVDGAVSSGIVPGNIKFYTSNSSGVLTLGMTLNSSQVLALVNPLLGTSGGTGINNGALTINLGSASTGYVLTSDSSGNATWASPAYLTGSVLLSPSADQTITGAHNLIMGTGSMVAPTMLPGNLSLSGNSITSTNSNGDLSIIPNGTGEVLVGSSTEIISQSSANTILQIAKGTTSGILALGCYVNAAPNSGIIAFYRSRSTTIGSFSTTVNADILGAMKFFADDGTSFVAASQIYAQASGAVSTGIIPTTLVFTTANTSGSVVVGMTLNQAQVLSLTNPLLPASGGTGTATAPAAGQIPIGVTGGTYTPAAINSGTGIVVANGSGSITVSATGGGYATATIAGTTQTAVVSTKYIALNAAQTTLTLPTVYAVGDVVSLIGSTANTGGWIVQAATGDTIRINNATTSSGGTVTCTAVAGQCIDLVCDVANTSWVMTGTSSVLLTTA